MRVACYCFAHLWLLVAFIVNNSVLFKELVINKADNIFIIFKKTNVVKTDCGGGSVFLATSRFPADCLPSRLCSFWICPPFQAPEESDSEKKKMLKKKKVSLLVEVGGENHGKLFFFHISKQWGENNGMFSLNFVWLWLQ